MAMKQQPTPFQLRNPYRLDRPNFDAIEVIETALAEEEEDHRLHLLQQQYQSAIISSKRPLPPQPSITVQQQLQQQQNHSPSFEDDNQQPAWNGINRVSNSIKRIKDFQRKNSLKDTERRQLKQQAKQQQQQQQARQQPPQQAALGSEEALSEYHHSYFSNSWLQPKGLTLPLTKQQQQRQQTQQPLPPIPSITVTHYIDTHSELTFERHVEWLTQTALWWDMPVVHLYPAPESPASLEYVETAASRFGSWVNFVKIPPGEDSRPGPATMAIRTANPGRVKGSRAKITVKETMTTSTVTANPEEDDTLVEGGMVMGHARRGSISSTTTSSSLYDLSRSVDPMVGYVFVGSADEQAQYSQVFEAMERLYPMIEIRYINSFEPQHLQSRQQQELREEPCLHSLSWVHYWSAAKESQVLQSRIVNEVVRVRPMWVNNELLHRNYSPPAQFYTVLPSTAGGEPVDDSDDVVVECLSPCPESTGTISPSPSVYIGGSEDDDNNDNGEGHSLEEVLRGVPSNVSIESFLDPAMNEQQQPTRQSILRDPRSDYQDKAANTAATAAADLYSTEELDLHGLSKRRPTLSRTQSSHDIRHDGYSKSSSSSSHRRSKKSRPSSSSSITVGGTPGHKSSSELSTGYRRSVSTPLLLLTKGSGFSKAPSTTQHQHQHHLDSSPDSDSNMSPPPPLKSYSSSVSNLASSSFVSSTTSMSDAASSMGFGHRLAGLAQRLGVYKVRGTSLIVVDL